MNKSRNPRRRKSVSTQAKNEPMEVEIVFGPVEEDETPPSTANPAADDIQSRRQNSQQRILFHF